MSVKCAKCNAENPDTQSFCGACGTLLRSVQGTDPKDVGPDPRSGSSSDDIPEVTKTVKTSRNGLDELCALSRLFDNLFHFIYFVCMPDVRAPITTQYCIEGRSIDTRSSLPVCRHACGKNDKHALSRQW